MFKLFKPKKRLTISDIKIPIPMLAGIENATNLTEEQIDLFLRGGKLNIPVEQQQKNQNLLPVILNEKIKSDESSSESDDDSDSEHDEDIIVDLLNKLNQESQQKNEGSPIINQPSSIPMAQDHSNIIDPTTPDKDTQKVPIQQQEPVKTEPLPQEIDSTLDVAPTPQKQVNMKKRAEQQHYHEKINILKYQLEKSQQQYNDEHQAHLRFVKERESMDHHIQHQISLAKQQLDHLRRAMPEGRQLRTSRSHHSLINDKQQQKHPMYSLEREEEEGVTAQDNRYDDARQRWMEAYYRYYNYYYRPCNDYYYYNEKRKTNDYYWDTDRYKPLYYGTKKGGKGADERRESAYYRVWR